MTSALEKAWKIGSYRIYDAKFCEYLRIEIAQAHQLRRISHPRLPAISFSPDRPESEAALRISPSRVIGGLSNPSHHLRESRQAGEYRTAELREAERTQI